MTEEVVANLLRPARSIFVEEHADISALLGAIRVAELPLGFRQCVKLGGFPDSKTERLLKELAKRGDIVLGGEFYASLEISLPPSSSRRAARVL